MKTIFIWIPKTAGTSISDFFNIEKIILKNQYNNLGEINNENKFNIKDGSFVTFGHANIKKINSNINFQKDKFITIVRNPYFRLLSLYSYHNKSKDFKYIKKYKNINEWILNEINSNSIPAPGSYNVNYTSQAAPMVDWLDGIDNLKIYKFENLEYLLDDLKEKYPHKKKLNFLNKSDNNNDLNKFNKESIIRINNYYFKDFEKYKYKKINI